MLRVAFKGMDMTEETIRRRPIKVRSAAWARSIASWIAKRSITPDQISLAGLGYAAVGGLCFALAGIGDWTGRGVLYLVGGLLIELRLLCNMLDGMVAVEGGKATPTGKLFNEVPDRLADVVVLVGTGCATGSAYGAMLGLVAAVLAVMTAYVRTLGTALGLPDDYSGPFAKPQRMHALAAVSLIAALTSAAHFDRIVMYVALAIIALGTGYTVTRRVLRAYRLLTNKTS
jgi:phosphatidylglycerophosphate synthase